MKLMSTLLFIFASPSLCFSRRISRLSYSTLLSSFIRISYTGQHRHQRHQLLSSMSSTQESRGWNDDDHHGSHSTSVASTSASENTTTSSRPFLPHTSPSDRWRVVSCFIMPPPPPPSSSLPVPRDNDLSQHPLLLLPRAVYLFQRAPTMPTYPGKWAAISGTMEVGELPETAAWRELGEETGLDASRVQMIKQGLYLDVDDEIKKRYFRIYPFLFRMRETGTAGGKDRDEDKGAIIRLDSEHQRFQLVSMEQVESLDRAGETVPNLARTLQRLTDAVPLLPVNLQAKGRALALDKTSGAAELAAQAAELVKSGADPQVVACIRATFAPVVNAAFASTRLDAACALTEGVDHAAASLLDKLRELQRHLSSPSPSPSHHNNLGGLVRVRVATISRSSTLTRAFRRAATVQDNLALEVWVSRSEPGGEGVMVAEEMLGLGITCTVVEDEQLCEWVRTKGRTFIDVLVFGADAILPCGAIVNKVGTRRLAQAAHDAQDAASHPNHYASTSTSASSSSSSSSLSNAPASPCPASPASPTGPASIPVWCCADPSKSWNDKFPPPLEPIFEVVPGDLISEIVQ